MPDAAPKHPFRGQIAPDGAVFEVGADETLLAALERAAIGWPSSCRNGTCRTCIGHLSQGHVRHTIEWPGLSAEEKHAGAVLPCVALACANVVLAVGAPV